MTVAIADQHVVSREGVESLVHRFFPDSQVRAVDSFEGLLSLFSRETIDLLIFDPATLEMDHSTRFQQLKSHSSNARFLAISDRPRREFILSVIEKGVQSFLTKGCSAEEIQQAIQSTLSGEKFFCNKVLDQIVERDKPSNSCDPTSLTKREVEVIQLICDGLKTTDIADRLNLSSHTVSTHRKNIMNKLQFKTPAELIRYAYSTSLVRVES